MKSLNQTVKDYGGAIFGSVALVFCLSFALYTYYTKKPDYTLLQSYIDRGNYTLGIANAEALLSKDSSNTNLVNYLAGAYLSEVISTNDFAWRSKASKFFTSSLAKFPGDADLNRITGNFYLFIGADNVAQKYFQKAITLNPGSALNLSAFGSLFEKNGNYDKATSLYNKALSIDNLDDLGNIGRIRGLYRNKREVEARALAKSFLEKTNSRITKGNIYEILGLDALSSGNFVDAEDYFSKALSLNINLPASLASYGSALYTDALHSDPVSRTKKLSQGEALALEATKEKDNYAFAYAVLSRIYLAEGNTDKSNEYKAKALTALPLDNFTSPTVKISIKNAFSDESMVKNLKIINSTRIFDPKATTTGITIVKKATK